MSCQDLCPQGERLTRVVTPDHDQLCQKTEGRSPRLAPWNRMRLSRQLGEARERP